MRRRRPSHRGRLPLLQTGNSRKRVGHPQMTQMLGVQTLFVLGSLWRAPLRRSFFLGPQDAIEIPTEVPRQVPLQIAPQMGFGIAIRIGSRVVLAITTRVRPQIAFRKGPLVALQIARRIAGKTHPPTPAKVPLEIAPGTVPGTVRTVVPGMSILATLTAPNASCFGRLGRFWLA